MERTIRIALNQFPAIPDTLRVSPTTNTPRSDVPIDLARLYHHYYLDSYGRTPPDPDPAKFEHLQFVAATPDFRFRGNGLGLGTAVRQHRSNELGQAFCRMFLHDHFGISYFAHMEHVLNHQAGDSFASVRVERIKEGDAPDYLCASSLHNVFLAEAKGRYSAISFRNREYSSWRNQFCRVIVKNLNGQALKTKGYVVATRYATEMKPRIYTTIFAEDPETPGEVPLQGDHDLGGKVIRIHYGGIATKLNQPLLASALINGFVVPEEIRFRVVVWEFRIAPLGGVRFVGGYYPSREGVPAIRLQDGRPAFDSHDPLRLDVGWGTFFGVEESIFQQVTKMARVTASQPVPLRTFERIEPFYSAVSVLRDGTIISPLEFLVPVDVRDF